MNINFEALILVIDDFEKNRKDLITALDAIGFRNVFEAEDGQDALNKITHSAKLPDLIFCDWVMPNMNGIELVKAIKANEKLKHIHIIMVTAESELDQIVTAIKSGASDYIIKPVSPDGRILEKKVQRYLKI